MNHPIEIFNLSSEDRNQVLTEISTLLQEKKSLQQLVREQEKIAEAANEELFLELLEVIDALEYLLDYMAEYPESSPEFMKNLLSSLAAVHKKFLSVLVKRQVSPVELTENQLDLNVCQVVDCEIRDDLEDQTIIKILRRGFRLGEKLLRPTEVITSKKD